MRRFPLRRLLGFLLSFAIVAGAPGSEAYHACAQSMAGRAGEAGSTARAVPVIGLTGLPSPIPALPSSLLSVSPVLSAPAVSPQTLAVPVAVAVLVRAAAAAVSPVAAASPAKALTPAFVSALAPLTATLSAAAKPERIASSDKMFDGSAVKEESSTPVFAGARRRLTNGLAILMLSAGLLGSVHQEVRAQVPALPLPAPVTQTLAADKKAQAPPQAAATLPTPAAEARAVLPRPVEATASIDRQGVSVGERVHLSITLRNTSDKPVTLQNLRGAVQDALPENLELQGKGAEAPLTLAPGESKTIVYEAIPFASGVLTLDGGIAVVPVAEAAAYPEGIEIVLPKTELAVASVLTPDWKEKGLRDIVGVKRADGPNWMWLAAIPLGILLLVGVKRLVDARRLYPQLDAVRLSLVTVTETEIARLRAEAEGLDTASFHARYQDLLTGFMVDFAGMPKAARDARTLGRDLHKSFYDAGQIAVAARLAAEAEAARFAGTQKDQAERMLMIDRLAALVESVAGKAGKPRAAKTGAFALLALLPGAAGLGFGSPWVLALLIPYAAYLVWSWRSRGMAERFTVSSAAQTPAQRTLRERFAGLPRVLRLAAVGLILVALARPMIGTQRTETFIPSTDTVVTIDLSGSMSGDKLQGVRDAVRGYVEEQRRGTENRVGMVTFSDNTYLDVKLTTDYDALIAHLKELETTGSTAIGKAILTSVAHFLELNALDLDGKADPRAASVQKLLRDSGLPAALAYAKAYPDLMAKILQPERAKIVVLFTDGDSNSGIDPQEAAVIAASLGVKIYGVGIAAPNESFNEATLRGVAEKTGAKFYRAGDAEGMKRVLLEIAHLEKSPAKIVSSVSVKDYTSLLAMLAFLMLGGELLLANTRLRTLYGMALILGLNGMPLDIALLRAPVPAAMTASVHPAAPSISAVPQEVIDGNKLYNQGRYAEALKKYGEAIGRHPDVPEIYFNMADSYLRLGETAKAEVAWQKYLSLTSDAKKQSQTLFNLGNSALLAKDAEKAVELYKEALRRDPGNQDAKWNLESLQQQKKDQDKQQSKDQKQKGKPGKQKGQPGDGKPGDGKPGDGKPGDGKPSDGKPSDSKPGDGKPGDGKPGDGKAQAQPAGPKEGADKLGDALGKQQGEEKDAANKGMTRKGSGVWGMAALPLAFAGHGIVFSSTFFLWTVGIGLPIAVLLLAWGLKKRLDAARKLSPVTAPKTFRSWWGARRFLGKSALALAAMALIGLASGDPRGGVTDERVNFGGKDIVVTVDGSYSMMYGEDGRMARTQKELNEFITRLQGTDRVGLVVFSGKARTASPISIDYGNFEFKINRLDVEARGLSEGSDLAGAVKFASESFEMVKKLGDRQRILIVISDGEVPEKDIATAIASAAEHGVTVYTIGVGDPAGTKINMPTADGKGSEYLIDTKTGAPAISRLNESTLRQLAERTGGAYFRSGDKTSIDSILDEVSRLEKGQKGDTIKSPRPIGVYLLWPALLMLLLDLVLPGRSLLKRGAPAKTEEKRKSGPGGPPSAAGGGDTSSPYGSGAAVMLGAALIPLGAWPQILPFAALATVIAGYMAADSWSGGALTRGVREKWQTWRGVVPKGVAADLIYLYDLREADERRLNSFVKGWQKVKGSLRETMIAWASSDEALWREKLTAAYLSGAAPETMEKILSALRRTARLRMEPLQPITDRIALRRADISWMAHSDSEARLAALQAAAAAQPLAFDAGFSKASRPLGLWARIKRAGTVVVLSLMIVLTGASSIGTINFGTEQRAAAEISTKLFYAEDLFIFTDRYVDPRIPELVLPALKRWTESPKTAGADFERALTILRESPDPKADNLLIAIFRHAGVLPLTGGAESLMLLTLIERGNDAVWVSMDQLIANSRTDEASARLLVKLVMLGIESGNEKATIQLFRVLKSPNPDVAQAAAGALFAHLSRGDGGKFFEGLSAASAKHAADPMLQMWTASFAFRRLSLPGVTDADMTKSKAFFDQALVNAAAIDTVRLAIYKATPPDQEVQAPPSLTAMLLGMADRMQGEGNAPAPLAGASRYLVTKAAASLILEGEKIIPGLHERLVKDGVVLPDTQTQSSDYGRDEYDDHGHGGYYGRGGRSPSSTTTRNYREIYKLTHLASLKAAIAEMAGARAKGDLAAREFADRAAAELELMLSAGMKSGMLAGGSLPEKVAESLLPLLHGGDGVFANHFFLRTLRDAGISPAVGDLSSALAYPETLDAAGLAKLRATFVAMAASGLGADYNGKSRPLSWSERLYLAGAVDAVDAAVLKNYPDASKPAPADALLVALARPGEESLILARLALVLEGSPKDAALVLKIEKLALARLAAAPADAALAAGVLNYALPALMGTRFEAEAHAALAEALKGPAGAQLAPVLRKQLDRAVLVLALETEKAFPKLMDTLITGGLRESDYAWRSEFKQRHYLNLLSAANAEAAKTAKLSPEQKAVMTKLRASVPQLKALGALLGVPAGDEPGDIAAELVNIRLQGALRAIPSTDFKDAVVAAGHGDAAQSSGWRQTYTRAQVVALRDWLKTYLVSGTIAERADYDGYPVGDHPRPLNDAEKEKVRAAIVAADQALAAFDAAAKPKAAHAFAPLALAALPALGLAPWLLFTALGLGAAYLAWRLLRVYSGAVAAEAREFIPGAVLARHRRIELSARRMATAVDGGNFRSRFIGSGGTDFAEARPYQNEDIREVDWKTSAKKDELYAKKFELERDIPLLLVVDISRSGRFGTRGADKRTAIEDAAAVLALAAAHSNIRVGAVLVSDRVELIIPARGGSRHAMMIIDEILKAEPTGPATDLKPGLETAGKLLGSRGMVAVLSDFIAPDFKDALGALAARHDVRAIRVSDPAEMGPLPDVGLLPVVDAETGVTRMLDTSSRAIRAEAASAVARREAVVEAAFDAAHINPILISTEGDPLETLERSFHPKARQPSKP